MSPKDDIETARSLLEQARMVHWQFPTSSGSPIKRDKGDDSVRLLFESRGILKQALATLLEAEDKIAAAELAGRTWRVWMMNGDHRGGLDFLSAVVDMQNPARTPWQANALYGHGLLSFWLGDLASSRARNEQALTIAHETGAPDATALANLGLARVEFEMGNYEAALEHARQATELARPLSAAMTQAPLHMTAQATRMTGRFDEAAALFAESLTLNRQLGDLGMVAVELHNAGHVEVHRGNPSKAEELFLEASAISSADDEYGRAMIELSSGAVAYARKEIAKARAHLRKAQSILAQESGPLAVDDQYEMDWLEQAVDQT